ncbi:hypothetical protein PO909_025797 [Leuciscus waleckii]
MAVLQVYQAKLLQSIDEVGPNPEAFSDLRSATDLALQATKATAQAIGKSMASLVVLERHLWLNLTEIKETDKMHFLDAPVSSAGLFGPAVKGFSGRFTEAQKASQAMRHFLPQRSSSASSKTKPASSPQPAKPAKQVSQPRPAADTFRQPIPAKHDPMPRRQGPRPAVLARMKREGSCLALSGPPSKKPTRLPTAPCLAQAAGDFTIVNRPAAVSAPLQTNAVFTATQIKHKKSMFHNHNPWFHGPPTLGGPLHVVTLSPPQAKACTVNQTLNMCTNHNIRVVSPLTVGDSSQTVVRSLATRVQAWQAILGVSSWVINITKRGYSLQFARRPPKFQTVVESSVRSSMGHVLRAEVQNLLAKGAIELIPPAKKHTRGFTAVIF